MYLERAVSVYSHSCTGTVAGLGGGELGKVWDPPGPPAAGRVGYHEELGKTVTGKRLASYPGSVLEGGLV